MVQAYLQVPYPGGAPKKRETIYINDIGGNCVFLTYWYLCLYLHLTSPCERIALLTCYGYCTCRYPRSNKNHYV
jgi:hypothetical protein